MFRTLKTVMVAALVVLAGAQAASAAVIPIGSVSLGANDFGFVVIDIENSTSGGFTDFYGRSARFVDVNLRFWADKVDSGPADDSVDALEDPAGPTPTPVTRYLSGSAVSADSAALDDLQPIAGLQYNGLIPPSAQKYAALSFGLQFEDVTGGIPAGRVFVDLLDLTGAGDCTTPFCETIFIYYQTAPGEVPVPEPATLLLLAGGLGTIAARRVRRRS